MMTLSKRMDKMAVHFFAALSGKIAALEAQGMDVVRLDEGNPDLPPAPHIIEALTRSAANPKNHGYQPQRGSAALRGAWAEMYRRVYEVDVDPDQEIVPLIGSKEGIFHTAMALLDAGDIVLVPEPGYITYTRGATFVGAEPYYFRLRPENGYLPNFEEIPVDVAGRAKMIWLNYPNNPTAASASLEFFYNAVRFAREYNILLCHDAAYAQVTFNGRSAPSPLQVPGAAAHVVEFNTLSKSHNMAGWRLGAAVGNRTALGGLLTLKTNLESGHFRPALDAAVAALTGDQSWLEPRNQVYRQRRDVVMAGLKQIGLKADIPDASLYVWSQIPGGWKSVDFANAALDETGVSLTPGTVFGAGGEGYIRIALTAPVERIQEAMDRLVHWRGV
jgi:LL-diaminopimelate aminotransferase